MDPLSSQSVTPQSIGPQLIGASSSGATRPLLTLIFKSGSTYLPLLLIIVLLAVAAIVVRYRFSRYHAKVETYIEGLWRHYAYPGIPRGIQVAFLRHELDIPKKPLKAHPPFRNFREMPLNTLFRVFYALGQDRPVELHSGLLRKRRNKAPWNVDIVWLEFEFAERRWVIWTNNGELQLDLHQWFMFRQAPQVCHYQTFERSKSFLFPKRTGTDPA